MDGAIMLAASALIGSLAVILAVGGGVEHGETDGEDNDAGKAWAVGMVLILFSIALAFTAGRVFP